MISAFLRRPILAGVASAVIMIAGLIAIPNLPIAQYPKVAPPEVTVTTNYIGANAEAVESAVTTPLEEAINGVPGLRYLRSTSSNDGTSVITATFNLGRDLDAAQADVQNAVLSATGRLPDAVRQTGVSVKKSSAAIILGVGIMSDGRMRENDLSEFAEHHVVDALKRVPGVEDVIVFGLRRYAMRVWLDPVRLQAEGLAVSDVVSAIQSQNVQVAAGAVGEPPTNGRQDYQLQLNVNGRLSTPGQFDRIILKSMPGGAYVRLSDVGRAELGAEDYSTAAHWNGKYTIGFGVIQAQDANALDVATKVRATLAQLSKTFPPGVSYVIPFDATLFVRESIREVIVTLAMAIALVVLVIYFFLQNWRMTLVPVITIPVSLIGTFALLKALGFSINTLTLFGITLATGLVVDDAIVVIENIARFVQEKNMSPFAGAAAAVKEITGAVIATSLVLLAVFVPVGFFPGSTGVLYKQFAITIACSISISLFTALTLAPSLSAMLLGRPHKEPGIFRAINTAIKTVRSAYHGFLPHLFRRPGIVLAVFGVLLALTVITYARTPSAFIPDEDQGYLLVVLQAPVGTSVDYERRVSARLAAKLQQIVPEAEGVFSVDGFGFTGNAPNRGVMFLPLKPWSQRRGPGHDYRSILGRIYFAVSSETDAQIFPVNPPPVQGIGNFGGFQFQVLDENDLGFDRVMPATYGLLQAANADPRLAAVFTAFRNDLPQLNLTVDRTKAEALQIPFSDVANTLGTLMGSQYVNDFDMNNRSYRVYVQAENAYRDNPAGLARMYVRSPDGGLVPLSSLVTQSQSRVPTEISHFNLFRSIEVDGIPKPGVGSGDAIAAMESAANKTLPAGMGYAWFGLSLDQIEGGHLATIIFALGLLFVFLVLAAQYENFWDPFIILLSVPIAVLGALWAIGIRQFPSDVFVQVGLVMLIGLASKNAILIVEFANQLRRQGLSAADAVRQAAEIRFRPIMMTSLAFIFGIMPLVFATGAGSASRNSLGTAVFGGMLVSTVLNLVFVPVLYVAVAALRKRTGFRSGFAVVHAPPHNGAKVHSETGVAANYLSANDED
ncbi:MAG TPA: efflux RND transporter permease subunit [Candidatus Baltobacteraceae bacterium]|nr:efflux RND transporter permease subunit [Candidatus Baltobacteraceae bacterium]